MNDRNIPHEEIILRLKENLVLTETQTKFETKKVDSNSNNSFNGNSLNCDEFFDLELSPEENIQEKYLGKDIFQNMPVKSSAETNNQEYLQSKLIEEESDQNVPEKTTAENTEASLSEEARNVMEIFENNSTDNYQDTMGLPEVKSIQIGSNEKGFIEFPMDSAVGQQLSSCVQVFVPFPATVRYITIGEVFSNKQFGIKMDIFASNETISKQSAAETRKEKIYHNIDKNLLEYYTTKTYLKNIRCPAKLQEKLREINKPVGEKCKLTDQDKADGWDKLKDQNQDVMAYFKQRMQLNNFAEYLFESLIKNKKKKFHDEKLQFIAEVLQPALKKLAWSDKKIFDSQVKNCLIKASVLISKIAGEAVEVPFLNGLFERRQKLINIGVDDLQTELKVLFEEAIIEANLPRMLWMLLNMDMIAELVEKLVKTRLIMLNTVASKKGAPLEEKVFNDYDEDEEEKVCEPKKQKRVKKH